MAGRRLNYHFKQYYCSVWHGDRFMFLYADGMEPGQAQYHGVGSNAILEFDHSSIHPLRLLIVVR